MKIESKSSPPKDLEQHHHIEAEQHSSSSENAAASSMDPERREAVEKSMLRKLDARCSLFVLIYIMNYLDRNNIAAARLKGLQTDLDLTDTQYSTCLSILYVGYILMQVPSNMIVEKIKRPSAYLGVAITLWGMISTLTGNVQNFKGMILIRFFLGFVEAAFLRTYFSSWN